MSMDPLLSTTTMKRKLDPEDAETHNVETMERIGHRLPSWNHTATATNNAQSHEQVSSPRLKLVAQRVVALNHQRKQQHASQSPSKKQQRRKSSRPLDLLSQISSSTSSHLDTESTMRKKEESETAHSIAPLYRAAGLLFEEESSINGDDDEQEEEGGCDETTTKSGGLLPYRHVQYGSIPVHGTTKTATNVSSSNICRKMASYCCCCFHPYRMWQWFYRVCICSFFTTLAIPLFVMAWIFYYGLGNPEFDFLPARLSWCLNFLGRQIVTLEIARISMWLLIDVIVLGRMARFWGPVVTMTALQARGWPFIFIAWAVWDLLLLHGDNRFQTHWLYWTGIRIYSEAQSGTYILNSSWYSRLLIAAMLAGITTTAKRLVLTIHFGRRMLADFKPRLEKLLADIVLVSEIASLAVEADAVARTVAESPSADQTEDAKKEEAKALLANVVPKEHNKTARRNIGFAEVKFDESILVSDHVDQLDEDQHHASSKVPSSDAERRLHMSPSGSVLIKNQLERWEEPTSKHDKSDEFTIQDVLKFKHALNCLDDEFPFGESYGNASDRNESIKSSHNIFWKLQKCSPSPDAVSFEILSLVAMDTEGIMDGLKLMALRKLFQPDARNELPLIAFIQSCDTVYKRLRYFKASVANASVIDNALEKILNILFWFVLSLMLLSILQFNPYPILVSITSLLVSISFALGSSVSKYVEGILLIAVRRPFDLGDRIIVASAESVHVDPGAPSSWFVEDISLFSTTLRYAKTNEVSSVNNFSISQSRIVNLQRSTNAIVQFELRLSIDILKEDKLNKFRDAVEEFVNDRPRIWDSFAFCRHDLFDADCGFILFTIALRHRLTWQSAARINLGRADLMRFLYELSLEMGIQYETPTPQRHIIHETVTKHEDASLDNFDPAGALLALERNSCDNADGQRLSGSELQAFGGPQAQA